MKKLFKVLGIALAIPVVGFVGLMAYAAVQIAFFSLPTDGPRVVETADYTFEAGEGWFTQCAQAAPGCLAVSLPSNMPTWKERLEWIEVAPVDAVGVSDIESFGQRAQDAQLGLLRDRAAAQIVATSDGPGLVEGTQFYELTNLSNTDYLRSAFVRFANGSILRFSCHAPDATHDSACAHALANVHFPAAVKAWAELVAKHEAEERRIAAQNAAREAAAEAKARADADAKLQAAMKTYEAMPKPSFGEFRRAVEDIRDDPELRALFDDWE